MHPFNPKKFPGAFVAFCPGAPVAAHSSVSCSPHCLLQRHPQAGHRHAGGLSGGGSKCLLVALCPRELGLLV